MKIQGKYLFFVYLSVNLSEMYWLILSRVKLYHSLIIKKILQVRNCFDSFFLFIRFHSAWIIRFVYGSLDDYKKKLGAKNDDVNEEEEKENDGKFFASQNPNGTLHLAYLNQNTETDDDSDWLGPEKKRKVQKTKTDNDDDDDWPENSQKV